MARPEPFSEVLVALTLPEKTHFSTVPLFSPQMPPRMAAAAVSTFAFSSVRFRTAPPAETFANNPEYPVPGFSTVRFFIVCPFPSKVAEKPYVPPMAVIPGMEFVGTFISLVRIAGIFVCPADALSAYQ